MKWPYQRFFYDEKHKLMVCAIPKTGISSFKNFMMEIASGQTLGIERGFHNLTKLANHGIQTLIHLHNQAEMQARIASFHKILLVRHPIIRLISAYKDKFFDHIYSKKHNHHIIKYYRTEKVSKLSPYANRPTWTEFVDFVVQHERNKMDIHWMRYLTLCQPCLIKYDTVIKLETIDEDIRKFLDSFQPDGNYTFGHKNKSQGRKGKTISDYLNELPEDLLQELQEFYSKDMTMFGYSMDSERHLLCDYGNLTSAAPNAQEMENKLSPHHNHCC